MIPIANAVEASPRIVARSAVAGDRVVVRAACRIGAVVAGLLGTAIAATLAADPITAPVVFPPATQSVVTTCNTFPILNGPAGGVHLSGGQFIAQGIGTVYATMSGASGCGGAPTVQFSPKAASHFDLDIFNFGVADDDFTITVVGVDEHNAVTFGFDKQMIPAGGIRTFSGDGTIVALFVAARKNPWAYGISSLTITQDGPPKTAFHFDLDANAGPQKLLLHKYREDDRSGSFAGYFSPYQVTGLPNDQPPQFRFPGKLELNGTATAGTVYVRVTDPPDGAPYVPQPAANDNRDRNRPKGTLFYKDGAGQRVNDVGGVLAIVANSDGVPGRANIFFEPSTHVAGENYQLEASSDPSFICATAGPGRSNLCAKSAIVTTWKRVYYETARMFRSGSHVALNRPSSFDERDVWVDDISPFRSGQVVRLIHAPRYQGIPAPLAGSGPFSTLDPLESFYTEDHVIDVVAASTDAQGNAVPAHLQLRNNDRLLHTYQADRSYAARTGPVVKYLADFVGVIGSGSRDFFEPDTTLLPGLYQDAFVEYVATVAPVQEVPYMPVLPLAAWGPVSKKWFFNAVRAGASTGTGTTQAALPNHQHLLGAAETTGGQVALPNGQVGNVNRFGETNVGDGTNYSWIFRGRIERAVTEPAQPIFRLSADVVVAEVSAHELAHQWRTNAALATEHCAEDRYQRDGLWCLMHSPAPPGDPHGRGMGDGLVAFHYVSRAGGPVDSEYMTIRDAAEPVPQQ